MPAEEAAERRLFAGEDDRAVDLRLDRDLPCASSVSRARDPVERVDRRDRTARPRPRWPDRGRRGRSPGGPRSDQAPRPCRRASGRACRALDVPAEGLLGALAGLAGGGQEQEAGLVPARLDDAVDGAASSPAVAPPTVSARATTPSASTVQWIRLLIVSSSWTGRSRDSPGARGCLVSETARAGRFGRFRAAIAHTRHTSVIELRFHVPDPRRRLAAVRLAHQLRGLLPHELTRNGRTWELTAPAPDVGRFEYQLELIDRNGTSQWILDPGNPKPRPAPGARSRSGRSRATSPGVDRARGGRRAEGGHDPEPDPEDRPARTALVHPEATERSPLVVAHDGPEYAEHSGPAHLSRDPAAAPRRPDRAGRPQRDLLGVREVLARAGRGDLPQLPAALVRVGVGASLGALALLHAQRGTRGASTGLFLQSGSFFRRASSHERRFRATGASCGSSAASSARRPDRRPVPSRSTCARTRRTSTTTARWRRRSRPQGYGAAPARGSRWARLGRGWRDALPPAPRAAGPARRL